MTNFVDLFYDPEKMSGFMALLFLLLGAGIGYAGAGIWAVLFALIPVIIMVISISISYLRYRFVKYRLQLSHVRWVYSPSLVGDVWWSETYRVWRKTILETDAMNENGKPMYVYALSACTKVIAFENNDLELLSKESMSLVKYKREIEKTDEERREKAKKRKLRRQAWLRLFERTARTETEKVETTLLSLPLQPFRGIRKVEKTEDQYHYIKFFAVDNGIKVLSTQEPENYRVFTELWYGKVLRDTFIAGYEEGSLKAIAMAAMKDVKKLDWIEIPQEWGDVVGLRGLRYGPEFQFFRADGTMFLARRAKYENHNDPFEWTSIIEVVNEQLIASGEILVTQNGYLCDMIGNFVEGIDFTIEDASKFNGNIYRVYIYSVDDATLFGLYPAVIRLPEEGGYEMLFDGRTAALKIRDKIMHGSSAGKDYSTWRFDSKNQSSIVLQISTAAVKLAPSDITYENGEDYYFDANGERKTINKLFEQ